MQSFEIFAPLILGAHLPPNQAQLKQLQQFLLMLIHHLFQGLPVIFQGCWEFRSVIPQKPAVKAVLNLQKEILSSSERDKPDEGNRF